MLRTYTLLLLSLILPCLQAPAIAGVEGSFHRLGLAVDDQELLAASPLQPASMEPEPAVKAEPAEQSAKRQEESNADQTQSDQTPTKEKSNATNSSPSNPYAPGTGVARIYDLGEEQLKSGDLKQAKETFRALAYKRPQDPIPMMRVAVVLARSGDLDEALVWTKKAVAYAPANVDAHLQLAHLLESNQELLQASLQYESAYSFAPTGDEKVTIESAWLRALVKCNQLDKANKVSLEVLKDKRSVESLYNRAWILSQLEANNAKEEAIKTYRKILDMDPGRHDARFNLANVLAQVGRREEAIREFQQFIQDAPDDPDVPRAKALISKLQASQ